MMIMKAVLKWTLLYLVTSLAVAEEGTEEEEETVRVIDPLIKSTSGDILGVKEESHNGNTFYSYYSIPYARPPVGELRFKNPVKVENWDGVRESTSYPPACPQYIKYPMMAEMGGQEDCLFINVFTPAPNEPTRRLPIMVFIHGGAFFMGDSKGYPPYIMMNHNIIFVTIQYRLGMLGFLSTEDDEAPGNLGLRDQVMALTWLQNNAHLFGGDPVKVTLFGESAGGVSVHFQILSPKSIGLFQRAILMSGTALNPLAQGGAFKEAAEYTAKFLNCSVEEGSKAMVSCLQKIPVDKLLQVQKHFNLWYINPIIFGPRIDGDFFPNEPEVLLKQRRHKKLDLMSGVTKDDGAFYSIPLFANEAYRAALMLNFPEIGPISLEFGEGDVSPFNQTLKIYDYYNRGVNIIPENLDNLTRMFSDRYFNLGHDLTTALHANNVRLNGKKVYRYELAHRGQRSVNDLFGISIGKQYVSHGDDLFYLFTNDEMFLPLENEDDLKLREIMTKLWTNFAEFGDPTPDDSLGFKWDPVTPDSNRHLDLKLPPTMADDPRAEIREFWTSLPLKQNLLLHPERVKNLTVSKLEEEKELAKDKEAGEQKEEEEEQREADVSTKGEVPEGGDGESKGKVSKKEGEHPEGAQVNKKDEL